MSTNTKKAEKLLPLITPGEILEEEFLIPMKISRYRVAKDLHVTPTAIGEIISGKRAITPEMALRLGAYFKMTAKFWLNLQANYDLRKLQRLGKTPKVEPCAALA